MQATTPTAPADKTMEKYRKVRPDRENLPEHIIRVNRRTKPSIYVEKIQQLLTETKTPEIIISSMGDAISKAVTVAEIVKHRVKGVHQTNQISTLSIDDEYEPLEEGLDKLTVNRKLTCLKIVLSLAQPKDKTAGYQEPLPESEVSPNGGPEENEPRRNNRQNNSRRRNGRGAGSKDEGKTEGAKEGTVATAGKQEEKKTEGG